MKRRFLAFFSALLMVVALCTLPAEAAVEDCNFYLEYVDPNEPEYYVSLDHQVKWTGYSHCVNLYHKVGQDYIAIDAGSLSSSDPTIVSVEYCTTDKFGVGATYYYVIDQLSIGAATLSYTYTSGGQQHNASYNYTVENEPKRFYMNTDQNISYSAFGFFSDNDDWSTLKRYGIRFYADENENSVILDENAIQFPQGSGTFTYQGNGYWDWDPTNATTGVYQLTYTHNGRTQYAICNVNAEIDEAYYSGDLMHIKEFGYHYYNGFGRQQGQTIEGICFYTDADYTTRIIGQDGFTFPDNGGTFTYMGDGLWNWDSSTGTIGNYEVRYSANGETYSIPLNIMDAIVSVEQVSLQVRVEHNGGFWRDSEGKSTSADAPDAWYWYSVPGHGDTEFKLTFASGAVRTMTMRDIHDEFGIWPKYGGTDPQYESHWTLGNTYAVTLYFDDVPCSFKVQLTENPFESIEPIEGQVFEQYTHGWWCDAYGDETSVYVPDAWFYYKPFYYDTLQLSVKLKGHEQAQTMTVQDIFETYGAWPEYEDTQSKDSPWTTGNTYPVVLSFGDVCTTLQIDIVHPTASGDCGADGENLTWILDNTGTLTISGSGAMGNYNYGDFATSPWCNYLNDIKKVVIEDGVTTIGDCAFAGCANLKSIEISDSVKSIGFSVVADCNRLQVLYIPSSVTTIAQKAFAWCNNLADIYYTSTQPQWESITIGLNAIPNGVTIHYNSDLTILARHIANIELITDSDKLMFADVNNDGKVNAADLTAFVRLIKVQQPV